MNLRKAFVSAVATVACTAGIVAAAGEASAAPATPSRPAAAAAAQNPAPVAPGKNLVDGPATRQERDQQALNKLGANVSTATTIGGLAGTAAGAVVGCIVGGIIIPAVGCIPGVITGASFGGILATVAVGGPTLIGNAQDYFRTINSPFVPPAK